MTRVDLPDAKITLEKCSENDDGEAVTHLQNMVYCFADIGRKMHDSILTWQVCQASNESIDVLMKRSTFFVIYNDSHYEGKRENPSVSMEKMKERMKRLAKQPDESILGGLDLYLNSFYKEIHTIDVDTFEDKYASKIFD